MLGMGQVTGEVEEAQARTDKAVFSGHVEKGVIKENLETKTKELWSEETMCREQDNNDGFCGLVF